MYIDKLGLLSDAQALSASALSTNVIDWTSVTPKRQVGAGKRLWLMVSVGVAADFTTGDETYQVDLYTSAAANMSSPVNLGSRVLTAAQLSAGALFAFAIPQEGMLEYFSAHYTLGGTTPTVTVTAWVTDEEPPEHSVYASGVTQAV
jgi:hypothetical protein